MTLPPRFGLSDAEKDALLLEQAEMIRKRSPEALLAFRVTSMVVRPEARSFRPTLWSTQMTTRRRKCTAVWKY
jgi:hypothetical protein